MEELAKLEAWRQVVVLGPLAVVLAVSAYTDFRERKVYNKVTYPAFFVGLLAHTIVLGFSGLGAGLAAAGVMFGIGLLLLPFGWMGGGDIKLLIVVGAFVGLTGLAQVGLYSVLVGGVMGMITALFNGYLFELFKRMGRIVRNWARVIIYRTTQVQEPIERDERSWVPFAIAVLGGAVMAYVDTVYAWIGIWDIFVSAFVGPP